MTPVHDAFEETIAANNVWALDERRIARVGEALRQTKVVHGLGAIAAALEEPLDEVVQPGALVARVRSTQCLKRYRRVEGGAGAEGPAGRHLRRELAAARRPRAVLSPADPEPEPQPRLQPPLPALRRPGQLRPELRPRNQRARRSRRWRSAFRSPTTTTRAPMPASAVSSITSTTPRSAPPPKSCSPGAARCRLDPGHTWEYLVGKPPGRDRSPSPHLPHHRHGTSRSAGGRDGRCDLKAAPPSPHRWSRVVSTGPDCTENAVLAPRAAPSATLTSPATSNCTYRCANRACWASASPIPYQRDLRFARQLTGRPEG